MNLDPARLADVLARQPLAPLWLLYGDAPLLVIEAVDAIRRAARADGYDEREVLIATGNFKWGMLAAAASTQSLFASRRLIELSIPSGKPGKDGGEALQRHVAQLPPDTLTIIQLPAMDWSDRKSAWFKAVSAAATCIEFATPARAALPGWLAQRLRQQGLTAETDALEFLADHVEGNLLAADQEIRKLALLHPADTGPLTLAHVQDAVLNVARYDIAALTEAMLAGDTRRCCRLIDGLAAEGAAPPLLLWMLAQELRTLASLSTRTARGEPLAEAFRAAFIRDRVRQERYGQVLRRVDRHQLEDALQHAAMIDRIIKGVAGGALWDELRRLVLRLG